MKSDVAQTFTVQPKLSLEKLQLGVLTFAHFFVDLYMNLLPPTLFMFVSKLDLTLSQQGLVMLVLSLSGSAMQPVFGYMVDRGLPTWLLSVSALWGALLMTSLGYIESVPLFYLLVLLSGLGSALYHPLASLTAANLGKARKDTAMSLFISGGSLGYSLAPLLVVPMASAWGLESLVWLAIPGVVGSLLIHFTGITKLQVVRKIPDKAESAFLKNLRPVLPAFINLNSMVILRSWLQMVLMSFGMQYFLELGIDKISGGYLLTLYLLAGTAGGLAGGILADHWGRKQVLSLSLLTACGLALFTFNSTGISLWVGLGLLGFFMSLSAPISVVMAQELTPNNAGVASGLMQGFGFGAGSLGLMLSSALAEHYGLHTAMLLTSLLLLPAALMAWRLPNNKHKAGT